MAPRTRIWRPELHAQIGPRNTKAVIAPGVDVHVRGLRHVTFNALRAGRFHRVAMMNLAVEFARWMLMARGANLIAGVLELGAVWIVAIGAADVLVEHFAFEQRRVFIHFVHDLAVSVISG